MPWLSRTVDRCLSSPRLMLYPLFRTGSKVPALLKSVMPAKQVACPELSTGSPPCLCKALFLLQDNVASFSACRSLQGGEWLLCLLAPPGPHQHTAGVLPATLHFKRSHGKNRVCVCARPTEFPAWPWPSPPPRLNRPPSGRLSRNKNQLCK